MGIFVDLASVKSSDRATSSIGKIDFYDGEADKVSQMPSCLSAFLHIFLGRGQVVVGDWWKRVEE